MLSMVVTLEVSTLSGWLNADALCRVEPRAYEAGRGAGREAGGRLKAGGHRARPERTANMLAMVVTLDVSKLRGWLNADADCRVERRAYDAGRGAGRGEA